MVRIDQFIHVIHSAVLSANDALMRENLKLLDTYFEDSGDNAEVDASLANALESIEEAMKQGRPSKESLQKVFKAFTEARSALQHGEQQKSTKPSGGLKAKTVTLQFPEETDEGVTLRNIQVPLITLIPVSMAKVSEVKFKTSLELQVENDTLLVGFPSATSNAQETNDDNKLASSVIEMTITPQESSEGLKKLIAGYEKILRSQIPN